MWCFYVVGRPPAKFHRFRSSFDSPTDNYSDIIVGQNIGRFRSPETVAGPPSLLSSQLTNSLSSTSNSRDLRSQRIGYCNAPRSMCHVSSCYSLLLPCHFLACCILSCHHVRCIIMFSKLASVPASSFSPLSVLSPNTLARARGTSEILFCKWPENVLRMG